jgi:two-component system, LytTR family, sensor kinase
MKFYRPSRFRLRSFWFSMIFINFAFADIMYNERMWNDWKVWLVTLSIVTTMGTVTFLAHTQYEYFIQEKFPSLEQTKYRVFFKLLENLVVITPGVLVIFYIFHQFKILGYQVKKDDLKYGFLVGLWVNLIFGTLFEVEYILNKYKETAAEKEMLEKLHLDQEFEQLKQKVNPHFLFNCFNTLSSLITEDKNKAEKFLDELSKVYRYLLQNNEEGLSTLQHEMKFIQNYFQLLKTRHGDAVQLQVNIDEQFNDFQLPSLSLQMLVENVVKHNSLSKNAPLVINIFTSSDNTLAVTNNLQRRSVPAPSNKVGLENIKSKYGLLKHKGFTVMDDEKNFTVVLPLISDNKTAINSATNK